MAISLKIASTALRRQAIIFSASAQFPDLPIPYPVVSGVE
jgi:hypothetical protein